MRRIGLLLLVVFVMMILNACGGSGEKPAVTDEAIQQANNAIHDEPEVRDSSIDVSEEDEEITFILQVDASTGTEKAQELGETYIKALASSVADLSDKEIEPPEEDELGGLYDHFDVRAGVKDPSDDLIVEGGKISSSPGVIWQ